MEGAQRRARGRNAPASVPARPPTLHLLLAKPA